MKSKSVRIIFLNTDRTSHTSVALRDVIAAVNKPCVEIHLSNIFSREEFRQKSLISAVCIGGVFGFGVNSYKLGLNALINHLERN